MKQKRDRKRRSTQRKRSFRELVARNAAFETLRLMRTKRLSLTRAAQEAGENGVSRRAVLRHVGKALTKQSNGRYTALPTDQLVRSLILPTEGGQIVLDVRGSRKASLIGKYLAAIAQLKKGEDEPLKKFEGKSIRIGKIVYQFLTDRAVLARLGYAGELQTDNFYSLGR